MNSKLLTTIIFLIYCSPCFTMQVQHRERIHSQGDVVEAQLPEHEVRSTQRSIRNYQIYRESPAVQQQIARVSQLIRSDRNMNRIVIAVTTGICILAMGYIYRKWKRKDPIKNTEIAPVYP